MKGLIKIFIIILVTALVGFGGYSYLQRGVPSGGDSGKGEAFTASVDGGSTLNLFGRLQSIELDTSFYSNASFVSLYDWGKAIEPEPVGRANPFAPIN